MVREGSVVGEVWFCCDVRERKKGMEQRVRGREAKTGID